MDKLSALISFVRAVDLGSFSAAAKNLGISQPAVSQQVRALEETLGIRLFNRTTRSLTLTEAGSRYYPQARDIVDRLRDADLSVQSEEAQMSGSLRIGLPMGFSEKVLSGFLIEFKKAHPCLLIEISVSDRFADILAERLDVAIRMGEIRDERLIVRKLGISQRCLVASPTYLDRVGRPKEPSDLSRLDYLLYKNSLSGTNVPLVSPSGERVEVPITPTMIVNNSAILRRAAVAGLGVGLYNHWMVRPLLADGSLEIVLPEWTYPHHPVHAVYPSNRFIPLKVRRFVDALNQFLRDEIALTEPDPTSS